MIRIKTDEQIQGIREASRIAASVLEMIGEYVKPGVTTDFLDQLCYAYVIGQQGTPTSLGYKGFPKSICTSINHVICHGIPGPKILKNGDIINIDIAVTKNGYIGDTSKMFEVGRPSVLGRRLCTVTYAAMMAGIRAIAPGQSISVIGGAIQDYVKTNTSFSIVEDFCGHGVGIEYHEEPQVLHFRHQSPIILAPGMIITIEPMINVGKKETRLLPDNWTVVTKDHSWSAQWEHTVLVTEAGYDILTLRAEETNGL